MITELKCDYHVITSSWHFISVVVNDMETRSSLVAASLLGCLWVVAGTMTECQQPPSSMESVYSFTAMNINKTMNVSLSEYKGRILVITNVATFWGLTTPHYVGFNALKSKFDSKPFEILAFPCNDFNLVSIHPFQLLYNVIFFISYTNILSRSSKVYIMVCYQKQRLD